MAKKRKEEKDEEDVDFKLPKFDEKKFIEKERRNIKTLFLSAFLGFVISLISFGFWVLLSGNFLRWELVLVFGVFNASWLKYLFIRLNIDLTDFGRKGWFGSYAIYFFTWLIVFIVLVNPPFYDDEAPHVELVILPEIQEYGGSVYIVAQITDNVGIEKQGISLILIDSDDQEIPVDFTFSDNILQYIHESPQINTTEDISYSFILSATDVSGITTEKQGSFMFSNHAIKLAEPLEATTPPGPKVTYSTNLKFDVEPLINRFYYTVDGGEEINVTVEGMFYVSSPRYKGWIANANVTVQAYAEVVYYFKNNPQPYINTIVDSENYYFNVSDALEIGRETPPEIQLPKPRYVDATPGFEIAISIISLLFVAFIVKMKKKDRK
ncbi:MAG: hypothetical protein R6V50_02980 [Thermoplasmatota archaeon]